jgi:hypothetical protein
MNDWTWATNQTHWAWFIAGAAFGWSAMCVVIIWRHRR